MFWKSPIFYQNKWHTIIYTSNIPSNLEIFHITRFLSIASLQQKSNNLSCPKNGYYPVSVQSRLSSQEGSMKCGVEGSLSCTSHRKTYNDLFSDHIHSISEGNFSVVSVVTRFLGGTVIAVADLSIFHKFENTRDHCKIPSVLLVFRGTRLRQEPTCLYKREGFFYNENDSSFVIQFCHRFPPKCAIHVNPYCYI